MTMHERLLRLRDLGAEGLAAMRRGDLKSLAALEAERRRLVGGMDAAWWRQLTDEESARIKPLVDSIQDGERRLRVALQSGLQERSRDLGLMETRKKAERAYRGI